MSSAAFPFGAGRRRAEAAAAVVVFPATAGETTGAAGFAAGFAAARDGGLPTDVGGAAPFGVPPLALGVGGIGEDVLPLPGGAVHEVVPVVDVELEGDEVLALDELAEERLGRRA